MTAALRDPLLPRKQWFELHDSPLCPSLLREGVTETLRTLAAAFAIGSRVAPLIEETLRASGTTAIVDLCSGSGGPAVGLSRALARRGTPASFTLTDKFPNLAAFARAREATGGMAGFETPVDAAAVPESLAGLRTLFNSFHHFDPATARAILADACHKRQPIAVFEFPERSLFATLVSFPLCLAVAFALAPFLRPRSARRLLLTYVVPAVPFVFAFDGLVSHFRAYSADEMERLVQGLDRDGYRWRTGKIPVLRPFLSVSLLLGTPGNNRTRESDSKS